MGLEDEDEGIDRAHFAILLRRLWEKKVPPEVCSPSSHILPIFSAYTQPRSSFVQERDSLLFEELVISQIGAMWAELATGDDPPLVYLNA